MKWNRPFRCTPPHSVRDFPSGTVITWSTRSRGNFRTEGYRGENTETSTPSRTSALGRTPTTSPSPPVLEYGTASEEMNATLIGAEIRKPKPEIQESFQAIDTGPQDATYLLDLIDILLHRDRCSPDLVHNPQPIQCFLGL